jgi:hypothetical protein
MRKAGMEATQFGEIDKKDFLIPPFAFFYFYLVFAAGSDYSEEPGWRFVPWQSSSMN